MLSGSSPGPDRSGCPDKCPGKSTPSGHTTHSPGGSEGQELKPCPFCGKNAVLQTDPADNRFVECLGCFVSTAEEKSKSEAITAWNRRTPDTTITACVGKPVEFSWSDEAGLPQAEFQKLVLRAIIDDHRDPYTDDTKKALKRLEGKGD